MAHELEIIDGKASFFGVKNPAWHGLGTIIEQAPTIREGIILAGLDWEVKPEPLYLDDGRVTKQRAIVRQSDAKILGYSSDQWQPVQNTEAFDFFQPFIDSGLVELETAGSLRGGQNIWVLAKIKHAVGEVLPNDVVQRYFMLSNAHTSGKALHVGFTDIRTVCANTLAIAENDAKSKLIRLTHGKNILSNLNEIQSIVDFSRESFIADMEKMRVLTRKGINRKDIEKFVDVLWYSNVVDFTERLKNKRENRIEVIENLMETGLGVDITGVKGTAYGLYQATTEFMMHHDGKNSNDRLTKLWDGVNLSRNEKALNYLLAM